MPRAPHSTIIRPVASDPLATTSTHPNVLKRNQFNNITGMPPSKLCRCSTISAKLIVQIVSEEKIGDDAKRPCSTCVRSHAHTAAHAPPGSNLPPKPQCTFDDVAEHSNTVNDGPKNKYEKLENRISELEALLVQKESLSNADPPKFQTTRIVLMIENVNHFSAPPQSPISNLSPHYSPHNGHPTSESQSPPINTYISASPINGSTSSSSVNSSYNLDLLRHLVDIFFLFHPHAHRLFHSPSFLSSLALPPTHPKFPSTPVLHAICAIGSLYTAAVTSPPLPNFAEVAPDEIFSQRQRMKEHRPDSFAEQQAKYAKETADHLNSIGEDLFQVLQANIIISWFYWSHSKWVFLSSAHSIRLSIPLGLNMCPPFHSITQPVRPASILPPARTIIEDETRRNTFWLAYATERQHGCGNGWALSLDDQDVSQLLPVRGDQFEDGTLVTPHERQWAHTKNLLLFHPEKQTDSFILYIKGSIMISQVKTFNLRFRAKHHVGDISVASIYDETPAPDSVDPRGTQAFVELDYVVSSFRASFPNHLRNPIADSRVDNHLYTACLMPHVATIILHDPHANVRQSGCISALKILTAARAVLDLIYNVWSTSFDITLLDSFCSFCWFVAGRVLVRFLQASIDAHSQDQISTLRAELDFVRSAIAKVGERIPLAFRFAKMLEDLILKRCGPATGLSAQLTFPRPSEPVVLRTLYEENCNPENNITLHEGLHEPGSFLSLA
ncbi:hypothetical protein BD779DRAFT_1607387 [Infundibulicybe gibba]|nr:hypothetical protein BD779DRAFT_1607387 [Infundibulicybe gibba]